jgi:cell filamentation protein, protein adenylyltransferase
MDMEMAQTWQINFEGAYVDLTDPELLRTIASVEAQAGLLDQIPLPPGLRNKVNRLNVMRAVHGTTGIEGSDLTEDEVERVLSSPADESVLGERRVREELEVRNAQRAMQAIVEIVAAEPDHELCEEHILELHRLTTEGLDYGSNVPGVYRQIPVTVGGSYLPPSAADVPVLMDRFFEWYPSTATDDRWPEVVRAIAAHFYLISIHPFVDGNGRTSRAVESLVLYRGGVNTLGFYSLANFYYRNRPDYEELLDRTRFVHDGDMTELMKFSLGGLEAELRSVRSDAMIELTAVAFRDFARERIEFEDGLHNRTAERRLALTLTVVEEAISVADIRNGRHPLSFYYRDTKRTLARDINYLEEKGLIVVEKGVISANLEIMRHFMG